MSSKKARRRKLQAQTQDRSRKLSPVTLFILAIGVVVALTMVGAFVFGNREGPPRPGAVWSELHGHWH